MLISEVFYSLQGEGSLVGVPSVFIRTSGCNLRCAWCDTPYASWNPEGKNRSIDELIAEIDRHPTEHVVLTGGEPMIAAGIRELAAELKLLGYHITIETAGTVAPEGIACDLASLSPKLLNSAPNAVEHAVWHKRHEATRWQPDVIRQWIERYPYQFKFVVSSPTDVDELEGMLKKLGREIPRHQVLLMPEARTLDTMRQRATWLPELCKTRGYRYAHRLHIELWGNKRGV
ncbi:MAG: 7-carboxy-7-deazaguanine synthase [Verrucomicrobia bacterium ADurb.Bin122]|mgnify:FL=1|jgi:7-carboxy-7-deazaguanine synthase|nr:MAG: 7-carboxy-7-deazaguanine synthase [Verrucomicrobia bacterium ADurb.Bin122]HNW42040.1 7-carboxy-7-deazaguanine synthase QueE [Opitutaceae bacterium]HOG94390.1 7-carboxy-7-deazaguanine synthase QueE [Opitutaceae bacterium]